MKEPEIVLKPSQWTNIGWIVFGLVGIPLVIPPLIALYKIIEVYCHRYQFYETHIIETKGVFSITHSEIYYFRIKSIQVEEPLLFRLVGLSNIHIRTSDQYIRELTLSALPVGKTLVTDLRNVVKVERANNNVRELDM
jgi:uncharacterized membrane protein YdbT with pleckstrin-like domain